jgi:hypothetical protein
MFDNKFLITLVAGLLVSVAAVTNTIKNNENEDENDVVENFGMLPSFGVKTDLIVGGNAPSYSNNMRSDGATMNKNNNQGAHSINSLNANPPTRQLSNTPSKGDFYSVPGTYQAMLAPRAASINYGADIKYNMPSIENQAVPTNPLTFSNMTKEGYTREGFCGQASQVPPFHSGIVTDSGYADGNYNNMLNNVYSNVPKVSADLQINLPVRDMTNINAGGGGFGDGADITQPVIYDRFMVANRNSRLRSQGDPIRGDIPIIPRTGELFAPSVQPNLDLQQGAMNVMGGFDNDTAKELANLIYDTSSGAQQTIGGKDLKQHFQQLRAQRSQRYQQAQNGQRGLSQNNQQFDIGNQFDAKLSTLGDISISAFP